MARIRPDDGTSRAVILLPHQTFGRAPSCRLRDNSAYVSHTHAELRWNGTTWQVQDLGSRNGTWVDGRRLAPGVPQVLARGSLISIGRPENRWEVTDDGPPPSMAEHADGRLILASDGLLALPGAEAPEATVYRNHDGCWVVDTDEGTDALTSGDRIAVNGEIWTIHLPEERVQTITRIDGAPTPTNVQLRLHLAGGEIQEILMQHDGRTMEVVSRASQAMLLWLAEQRLADRRRGVPTDREGWRDQVETQIAHDITANALNVAVFRLRQAFASAGLTEASGVIERVNAPRQLRLGIGDIEIVRR